MTIYEYVLAQIDARERAEERARAVEKAGGKRFAAPAPDRPSISIAGDLGGRAYTQRDARRKWARAA